MSAVVSVIIPSFDRRDLLLACIESVNASTPQPDGGIEIIVVTAADGTAQTSALRNLGAKVICLPTRQPVSHARNVGASQAAGDYLLFLDDDNVVAADAIWRLWRALGEWPDAVLTGPAMYFGS